MNQEPFSKSVKNHFRNILKEGSDSTMAMTFNVLVTQEDNIFVAHCLELDIVATSPEE